MDFFSIKNTFFTIAGNGVSYLEFFSVLLGLTTVFLAGRGKIHNYWVGYAYSILLFFLFFQKSLYSSMILQPISLAIAVFGHYRWSHPKQGEANKKNELKVTILNNKSRIIYLLIIAAFALLWGLFLKNINLIFTDINPANRPFLDAMITATLLIAQYLSAQKKLDCWGAWLIVNASNITLYILAGLAFMPMVSGAYLIMAFLGFAAWRKQHLESK